MAITDSLAPLELERRNGRRLVLSEQPWQRLWFPLAIAAAVVLGFAVRASYVFAADFPLNDGGLFYQMTRELQEAGYRLPAATSYNEAGIPFSYPPAGFYVAGLIADLTPLSLLTVFRLLPLLVSTLTIVTFLLLARDVLRARVPVAVAVFAFALVPRSFIWMIMGGGVTRSLGLLFALLALHQVYQLYTRPRRRAMIAATLLCGLTVLSHLETAWFLAYSVALFFLAYGRNRQGVVNSVFVALGTVAVTAPWWGTVIARHGLEPFLAARETGGSVFSDASIRGEVLRWLARFGSNAEPFFPLIGVLALLGVVAALARGRWLLPAWWVTIILLDWRAFMTFSTVPVALLAGLGVAHVLLPVVQRGAYAAAGAANGAGNGHAPRTSTWAAPAGGWAAAALLASLLVYTTASALLRDPRVGGESPFLVSLSRDERAAMAWVARESPPESRFLLLTGGGWPTDRASEWFPVLAARVSVATVQGTEWLPHDAFRQVTRRYDHVQGCDIRVVSCIENWLNEWRSDFTHVFVPKTSRGQCCTTLLFSLSDDPRYQVVYDGPGATIFVRHDDPSRTPAGVPRS